MDPIQGLSYTTHSPLFPVPDMRARMNNQIRHSQTRATSHLIHQSDQRTFPQIGVPARQIYKIGGVSYQIAHAGSGIAAAEFPHFLLRSGLGLPALLIFDKDLEGVATRSLSSVDGGEGTTGNRHMSAQQIPTPVLQAGLVSHLEAEIKTT